MYSILCCSITSTVYLVGNIISLESTVKQITNIAFEGFISFCVLTKFLFLQKSQKLEKSKSTERVFHTSRVLEDRNELIMKH